MMKIILIVMQMVQDVKGKMDNKVFYVFFAKSTTDEDDNIDNENLDDDWIIGRVKTSASYGGVRHVEVIAKEIFPNKFPHKFTRKKLTTSQKRALNRKIYAESQWRVGKKCIVVHAKICMGYSEKEICDECLALKHNNLLENRLAILKPAPQNLKFTPKFYFEIN
ncbi:hypothetical protein RhiirA1_400179 [Rhizophagus irregularis]|uniref:Uncharacterized protein n=1 Tax=Rhizophagus irregularis TaxID=588596 RepID=A0A2N0R748_9GLOM|nr:hypothetical protein RhiirA1_400179 [Rhizophagus irregularis]